MHRPARLGPTSLADHIRTVVTEPFEVNGHQLTVGASIGVATAGANARDAAAFVHHAYLAMYRAKQCGKRRVERFDPGLTCAEE